MLSRNFRLQKVGDLRWLSANYDFSRISHSIDELIVLDVTRGERDQERFAETLGCLVHHVFVPVAAGGGIDTAEKGERLLRSGADKLVVNTALHVNPETIRQLVRNCGSQCVVVSIDVRKEPDGYAVYCDRGNMRSPISLEKSVGLAVEAGAGEVYLNSIDRDGTGFGYETEVIGALGSWLDIPLIIAGGAGNACHLIEGARLPGVDAVATANLFNFIGDGLPLARRDMLDNGIDLARWNPADFELLKRMASAQP
jgi:cyclase